MVLIFGVFMNESLNASELVCMLQGMLKGRGSQF
jgi:hypothetical protein